MVKERVNTLESRLRTASAERDRAERHAQEIQRRSSLQNLQHGTTLKDTVQSAQGCIQGKEQEIEGLRRSEGQLKQEVQSLQKLS